ncbi:methyl farnesoate epoxidase-like [Neocloeon triangulifer]|uniref:methyl farnesoate epoxidase-like n=1 Tax=Neocloeon triangulifer TaxID=2078957 RepID=UPI00286F4CCF|nr:methyl farnesoate epoxidase-like [Neocloeon triangulifer]
MIVEIVLLVLVTIVSFLYIARVRRYPHFPPGPPNYPVVGSLLALRASTPLHETLFQLSKKYGPVVGLFLGPQAKSVVVNGYEAVKHVLMRDDFANRPDGLLIRARSYNKRLGVLFSDGPLWKEQRRFSLRHLRDFGFGKRSMEGLNHEEISTLMQNLDDRISKAGDSMDTKGIEIKDLFPVSVINILWAIMAGVRYDHNDESFKTLMFNVNEFFRNGSPTGGIMAFPLLRFVPIVNIPYKKQLVSVDVLQKFIQKSIDDHKETYQEDNMRDFLDVFIKELKEQENNKNSTFTEEQLVVLCMDLFLAGTETTASSLGYFFLYLMQYPKVQEKMRQEIFKVVGRDRLPSLEDMPKLHYVQAATWEVLRMANLIPFTVPHFTRQKVELFGYTVPRNCLVMVNLYSVMMDDYWGDPETFRPERFIKDGVCVKNERLILFGMGPRVCLGEPLAKNTSFLFLTSLLQKYRFSLPAHHQKPNMDHLQGFTSSPRPYKVSVHRV